MFSFYLCFLVEELEVYDAVKKKINNEKDAFSVLTGGESTPLFVVSLFQPSISNHYVYIYHHCTELAIHFTIE